MLQDAGSQLGQQQCQLCRATWVSPRRFLAQAAALFHYAPLQHKVMAGEQRDTWWCAAQGALQEQGLLRLAKDVVSLQQEKPLSLCKHVWQQSYTEKSYHSLLRGKIHYRWGRQEYLNNTSFSDEKQHVNIQKRQPAILFQCTELVRPQF